MMWSPLVDLESFNRYLLKLEQAYLAVLRKTCSVESLFAAAELPSLFDLIDSNPRQAVAMARIKSGHSMTPRHGLNVLLLVRAWAVSNHRIGSRLHELCLAALVHDLGHWRPDNLVFVFDQFSQAEFSCMCDHSRSALSEIPLSEEAKLWLTSHHEQPDGRGYPDGICNPHPLAQLLRICDCYDGLTTPRRFRPAYSAHRAMVLMARWAGYKYSVGLFQSFFQFMGGNHPFGSFVVLKNGALAIMLPAEQEVAQLLLLTDDDGEKLAMNRRRPLDADDVVVEANHWQQVSLPKAWANLRPDLLNLPRFYP